MAPSELKSWAEQFSAELIVDGEHIPFERVLARHLDALTKLRNLSGHTWPGIASLLTRAGARRADGGLISADQIRVGYSRLIRHAKDAKRDAPSNLARRMSAQKSVARTRRAAIAAASPMPPDMPAPLKVPPTAVTTADEDLSDDDIAAALERLNKLNKK